MRKAAGMILLSTLAACVARDEAVHVGVAPTILVPHALLANVKRLTVTVYESTDGADCDAATGAPSGTTTKPIVTKDLGTSCPGGAPFCGDLQIQQADTDRVFGAAGFAADGTELAVGCTKAKVNQDALPVEIKMRRYVKPAVCGDGTVEPTEQCEGGSATDPLCDEACHTREILLSAGHGAAGSSTLTTSGKPGDKVRPFFLWPALTGDSGRFLAFFGDKSPALTDVDVRVLSDSFARYDKQGPELADYSFFLPNNPTASFPPAAAANNQLSPTAAVSGSSYFVAFEDDTKGSVDIALRSMDTTFTAEQAQATTVNGSASGEAGVQSQPSMAASSTGLLFVAWQDEASGSVQGRIYDPQGKALGVQHEISTGSNNKAVVVAANGTGWVATWQSGQDIKVRSIGADGTPLATESKVNDGSHAGVQEHPWVAGLPDGRFAIVWTDRGSTDIFVQRFGADTKPLAGDQQTRVNDRVFDGDQSMPTLASSPAAGGSYVAAWVEGASGHIQARLLGGGGGYLFNNVDGQDSEFRASGADGRTRTSPTIAVGGAGPYVAIGWADSSADKPGIYGRRFPLPAAP